MRCEFISSETNGQTDSKTDPHSHWPSEVKRRVNCLLITLLMPPVSSSHTPWASCSFPILLKRRRWMVVWWKNLELESPSYNHLTRESCRKKHSSLASNLSIRLERDRISSTFASQLFWSCSSRFNWVLISYRSPLNLHLLQFKRFPLHEFRRHNHQST